MSKDRKYDIDIFLNNKWKVKKTKKKYLGKRSKYFVYIIIDMQRIIYLIALRIYERKNIVIWF